MEKHAPGPGKMKLSIVEDLTVKIAGHDVIKYEAAMAPRRIADRTRRGGRFQTGRSG
jgi:hypothetical protein